MRTREEIQKDFNDYIKQQFVPKTFENLCHKLEIELLLDIRELLENKPQEENQ